MGDANHWAPLFRMFAGIANLKKRSHPISYVELGEEPDGQRMLPEDYAALYVQWAAAIHRVDPTLKPGGPAFEGVNEDIKVWPDADGGVSWFGRFLDYLKARGSTSDLAFMYYFHLVSNPLGAGCGDNGGGALTFLNIDRDDQMRGHLSQYFASQVITREWVQPVDAERRIFRASSDLKDSAGHVLVTAYAVLRPNGEWSPLMVNKDHDNPRPVNIAFEDAGKRQFFSGPVPPRFSGTMRALTAMPIPTSRQRYQLSLPTRRLRSCCRKPRSL